MSSFVRDLRLAVRSLWRDRWMAAVVVGTLGIGIGAVTAVFSIVSAALLRPPPFPAVDRLVMLYTTSRSRTGGTEIHRWSYPRIELLRAEGRRAFAAVANVTGTSVNLTSADDPEPLDGELVSSEYLAVLGVQPLIGRGIFPDEDATPGQQPVVVLGYDVWQRRYGGDRAALGRTIGINGTQHTIVGVMPEGFRGLTARAQLWLPATMAPRLTYPEYLTTNQDFISVIARLRDGETLEHAQQAMAVIGKRVQAARPSDPDDHKDRYAASAVALNDARIDTTNRRALILLLGAVGMVLLLASANVASLLLGRAAARRREIAVRLALGASRGRLIAQLLTETLVLAVAGGALGVALATWLAAAIPAPSTMIGPRNMYGSVGEFATPGMDGRVLAFALGVSLLVTLLCGLAPALGATRLGLSTVLREGAPGATRGAATARRLDARGMIIVIETALAVVLLAAGGLMLKSFVRMRQTDLGFDPSHLLTFYLRPPEVRYPTQTAPALIGRVLDAVARVPGVEGATVDACAPLGTSCANTVLYIAGRPLPAEGQAPVVLRHYIGPDHFRVLGIPMRRGRAFTAGDRAGAPKVVIINETAARRYWPNEDPIGKRIWFGGGAPPFAGPDSSATIVGVAGDVPYQPLSEHGQQADFFTPYQQFTYAWRMVIVRSRLPMATLLPAMRAAVASAEPGLPLHEVRTMEQRIGESWARHRLNAALLGAFSVLAIVLAATGIYSVVAHSTAQRTRELGIRIALGATPWQIVRLVIGEGVALPFVGLTIGTIAAFATTRVLRALLYGVNPNDSTVFSGVPLLLAAVAIAATAIPARRATRVDPMEVLRAE